MKEYDVDFINHNSNIEYQYPAHISKVFRNEEGLRCTRIIAEFKSLGENNNENALICTLALIQDYSLKKLNKVIE